MGMETIQNYVSLLSPGGVWDSHPHPHSLQPSSLIAEKELSGAYSIHLELK